MIPICDVTPEVPSPPPTCSMPTADEITEEGFGHFRGTWFIGHVRVADANAIIRHEAEVIQWLDDAASTADEFERLACAIETGDVDLLDDHLREAARASGLDAFD